MGVIRGFRAQKSTVVAVAVGAVLTLGAGMVGGSDAQSPFDIYNRPTTPTVPDIDGPRISAKGAPATVRASRSGSFSYTVGPFDERARGQVAFTTVKAVATRKKRRLSFGSRRFVALPGRTLKVTVKLGRTQRKVLKRAKSLRLRAKIVVNDRFGNESERSLSFTLKRPR